MKPDLNTIPEFYKGYIQSVLQYDYKEVLAIVFQESIAILDRISEEKANYAYADDKWTIKDIVQHLTDSERIFSYRALVFSRGESQKVIGYDHDTYVDNAFANTQTFESLLNEFKNSHQSTNDLFNSFSKDMLQKIGNANGFDVKVIDLIYLTSGHQLHHIEVLKKRYL